MLVRRTVASETLGVVQAGAMGQPSFRLFWFPVLLFIIPLVLSSMSEECQQWSRRNPTSLSPRARGVMELLWSWRRQHELSALEREINTGDYRGICQRKYVFNSQFDLGCNLAGNHFGAAASSLLASIVLNRTMIFTGVNDVVIRSCQGSIYFKPWILTREKLEPLLEKAGCNVFQSREKFFTETHNFVASNPTSKQDGGVTRFCGYARSPLAALTYDDIFNSGVELFVDNPFLSAEAKRRTEILFSNPILGLARFEPYGLLVRSFVGFTNQTVALAKAALEGIHRVEHRTPHECLETLILNPSLFVIGVHLRHKRVDDSQNAKYDEVAKQGILRLKAQHDAGLVTPSKCVILVASDRAESIKQINEFVEAMKLTCTVRFVQRNMTASVTQQQKDEHYEETGPFAQAKISMADWYLLSHSDYFLGTADSTFSFLIADIVASRLLLQPTVSNAAAQAAVAVNSTKSPFLWELPPPSQVLIDKWVSVPAPEPDRPPGPGVVVIEHLEYERQRHDNKCPLKPSKN